MFGKKAGFVLLQFCFLCFSICAEFNLQVSVRVVCAKFKCILKISFCIIRRVVQVWYTRYILVCSYCFYFVFKLFILYIINIHI